MMMKKLYKLSLTAFMLLFCTSLALAQERTVSGTVSDEAGQPLPGVNVLVKGTSQGTVTDTNGSFSIGGVNDNSTLVFSFIGYKAKEVVVGTQTSISLNMDPDATSLEEVVVVGYGEQKKSLVTGAISSVRADELTTVSVGSIDQAIQGRTSGVQISPNSGQPGAASRIRIRGTGTNGNPNPLFIIDGVMTGAAGMDYLNPNDIQSIEILKDAASLAIYGIGGGNGVVIVTTKKGRANTSAIEYNGQYAVQSLRPSLELMNQDQYMTYMEETGIAANLRPSDADRLPGQGTDWQDVAFDNAPMQNHTLNFTGGTDKSSLFISGGYFKQEGIAGGENSLFKRYTIRINSNHKLREWLNIGENFSFTNRDSKGLAENTEYGGVIGSVLSLDPTTPAVYSGALPDHAQDAMDAGYTLIQNDAGQYYGISRWITGEFGNPLITYAINNGRTVQNKALGNVYVELTPIPNFKFTSRYNIDAAFQRRHNWNPTYYYSIERFNNMATGDDQWNQWFTTQWENFANYDKAIGDHHFNVTVGTAFVKGIYDDLNGSYSGLFKEQSKWSYPTFVPDNLDRISGSQNIVTQFGYFGRLNYDFKGKYLFGATVRRDGHSYWAEGHQWGTFPSVSAGWVASNEDFFANLPVLSYLKVRGSWGQNGSTGRVGRNGQWTNAISNTISGAIRYPNDLGEYQFGAAPVQAPNYELTWETSEQWNIGLESRLLNDNLSFTFDFFNKATRDLLAPGDPPRFVGIGMPEINSGSVENKGFEIELDYSNEIGSSGLKYSLGFNYTNIKNEVTSLNKGARRPDGANVGTHWGNATRFVVGEPIWSFYGYKTAGIFQTQEEVDQYIADNDLTGYAPVPGDPIVVDANGDKTIGPSDFVNIGNPHPTYYYGARLNLSYKGVDFLVFANGQGGNDIMMAFFRTDRGTANKPEFFYTDRWTGEGSTNDWFRASTTGPAYSSDLMITKGNFMKIRQLQLGYTFPASINEKLNIKNLRIYGSLDNWFVFTKYKGFDPEVGIQGDNSVGVDRGTYPTPRKAVIGATLTF
jgi:TonB-dependent starch-binding outer membrane protein SusC